MKRVTEALLATVIYLAFVSVVQDSYAQGLSISPQIAGNDLSDSICITFSSIDTTLYPEITDLDSFDVLQYDPAGARIDSVSDGASSAHHPTHGFYRVILKSSDAAGEQGLYSVLVRGWLAGKERGIASGSYQVVDQSIGDYLSRIDTTVSSRGISNLDVSHNIGINWADIDNQDAAVNLSSTTIPGGASADTAAVARSVWNNAIVPLAGRRTGYADSVGTVESVPSSGTGAYPCSLYYFCGEDTSAIQGVFSRALNSSQTATSAISISNSNGLVVFSLDNALYRIWSYLTGFTFEGLPKDLSVTSPAVNDTIWATRFDPGDPPSPALCRVYGWVLDLTGNPIAGAAVNGGIRYSPLRYAQLVISPYSRSTVTDSAGYWYLDLIPSGELVPENTTYMFSINSEPGPVIVTNVVVPDLSSWQLTW
jgi:hypothetical protein